MAWSITGSTAFAAFAAIVQLVIGGLLLRRNLRNERVALIGLLFLLNGIAAAVTFAGAGFSEVRDSYANNAKPLALGFLRTGLFVENCTNLLLLLLAAIYPRRVSWLRRAPHIMIIFAAMVVALFVARVTFGDDLLIGRRAGWPLTGTVALVAYGVFDMALPILMLRWAWLWREPMTKELRAQFALVFAAIGVRAVHQMVFVPYVEVADVLAGRQATTAGLAIGGALAAFVAVSLLVSIGLMITSTRRFHGRDRAFHWMVLGFMAFGALEGALNIFLNRGLAIRWWDTLSGDFDTLVIRPVLIWFAITRTQFLDIRFRSSQLAWTIAFVLTGAAVMGGVYEAFGDRGSPAVQWSLSALVGVAVASIVLAVSQAIVLVRGESWGRPATPKQVYVAQLDEAYRNGPPSMTDLAQLAQARAELGIDDALHAELEADLAGRLAGQKAISTSAN